MCSVQIQQTPRLIHVAMVVGMMNGKMIIKIIHQNYMILVIVIVVIIPIVHKMIHIEKVFHVLNMDKNEAIMNVKLKV